MVPQVCLSRGRIQTCSVDTSVGTGKTMLVKAVAHHTTAAFIRVVGSEFVQKYLGEGPRMVRDVFRLARENTPAIIFIDEIDAIATKRFDAQTGADREVQRILLELLNQMDGFDQGSNVKVSILSTTPSRAKGLLCVRVQVIMATNRQDTLDPALLRPGRLDRKIEFPLPSRRERRLIFQTVTSKMNLGPDVDLEDCTGQCVPVSYSRLTFPSCLRRFTARSFVLCRNIFSCSSRWITRHAMKFLRYPHIFTQIHSCSQKSIRYLTY